MQDLGAAAGRWVSRKGRGNIPLDQRTNGWELGRERVRHAINLIWSEPLARSLSGPRARGPCAQVEVTRSASFVSVEGAFVVMGTRERPLFNVPVRRTPSPNLSAAELLIADGDTRHLGSTSR